jgi:hypothetical protein
VAVSIYHWTAQTESALAKPKPIADAELTALGWTVKDLQVPKLFQ